MEQVNFIFKFLPVDITYVDENDKVVFYNRGDERVFPRSAGIIGREVKTFINNEFKAAGTYQIEFNGSNLSSGVYFYRLESEKFVQTKRMVLIK